MSGPRFASALSTSADTDAATRETLARLHEAFDPAGDVQPDLVAVFATHHHGPALERLGSAVQNSFPGAAVIGCTGVAVIGGDREAEGSPGLSLWAGHLPGTEVRPFRVRARRSPEGEIELEGEPDVREPERASVILLCDPYTFPANEFLEALEAHWPGVPVIGGMASGGSGPGQNFLISEGELVAEGALGVVLEGDVGPASVVSQGCRPVGKPWVITACERNLIQKLGGKPALEAFVETLNALPEAEQELLKSAPFVGLAIDATKSEFERGDFLVRGVLGQGPKASLGVNDLVRRGQTVQFLVRDADSASEDLRLLMETQGGGPLGERESDASAGALLFSCNGRGTHMFSEPDHDLSCVRDGLAPGVPVAGFFAAGEIGPVGGRNFLHGFTASVAVFRARPSS